MEVSVENNDDNTVSVDKLDYLVLPSEKLINQLTIQFLARNWIIWNLVSFEKRDYRLII